MNALSAIAAMQYRAFLNSMRRGSKRDPLSTVMSALATVSSLSIGLLIGGAMLFLFAVRGEMDPSVRFWIICIYGISATIFSLLASVSGESHGVADARSLQLLPLSLAALTRLDLLAEFLAPSVLMFAPGFAGIALGSLIGNLVAGPALAAVPAFFAIAAEFLCLVTLVRIVSTVVVTSGRRLREWAMLILLTGFIAMAYLGPEIDRLKESGVDTLERIGSLLLRATFLGSAADIAVGGSQTFSGAVLSRSFPGFALDVLILSAWVFALLRLHRRVTARVLAGEGGSHTRVARGPQVAGRRALLSRVIPTAVFGVASADIRSLLRIPMMWILLLMPALFGVFISGRGLRPGMDPVVSASLAEWTLPFAALGAHILFSAQLFSNVFGIDREAAALFLLAPLTSTELFLGKSLARLLFGTAQIIAFLAVLAMRTPGVRGADVLRGWASWAAAALWVSALGMLLSIRMPVRMTFGAQKEQRFERAATSLLSQGAVALVLLPPAAMILGGRLLQGTRGYVIGISVTAISGIALWIAASFVAGELLARRGPEMVEGLSARG